MPLTAAELKDQVLLDLGDSGGYLDAQINTIWTQYDAVSDDNLHALYVKRHLAQSLMGHLGRMLLRADPDERELLDLRRRVLAGMIEMFTTQLAVDSATANPQYLESGNFVFVSPDADLACGLSS